MNDPKLRITNEAAEKAGMKPWKEKRKEINEAKRKEYEEREAKKRAEVREKNERLQRERRKKKDIQRAALDADKALAEALMRYEDADTKALRHAEEQLQMIRAKGEALWRKLEQTQSAQIDAELKLKKLQGRMEGVLPALEAAWEAAEAAWAETDKAFRKNPHNRDRALKKAVKDILR